MGGLGNRSGLCMATTKVTSYVLSPDLYPSPLAACEKPFSASFIPQPAENSTSISKFLRSVAFLATGFG